MNNFIEIYDNFLEQSYFNDIEKLITMHGLPWYTTREISTKTDLIENLYYQTHTFFEHHRILSSEWFNKLTPLLEKLDVKALIRIRANMYAGRENISVHGYHTDCEYKCKAALLYINDNDGYTEFEKGGKVESKANRLIIFNANERHRSTNCTNTYARFNINFNYF
jgi:hypothetical protein